MLRLIILSTLGLFLSSCELRRDLRPSILVIAVENLAFDSVSCDTEDENPGFDVFCDEGIRFTHAFTPSTLSQSSLASILTGMYPTRHGVHDNGNDHLAAKFRTVGEAAVERGYRTIFISGGPPIFRKSGLAQGFELFEDGFDLSYGHYYRPVSDVFSLLQDWWNKEAGGSPVFAMTYLADLQFPELPTFTQAGEMRESSVESQLQEVGEALQTLVDNLKSKRRWDSTNVILVGLGGGLSAHDLKSDNTQVAMFIKPARQPRDKGSHWTIDRNVSLVDIGVTLFSILGERVDPIDNGTLEKVSLQSALSGTDADWRDDRVIYSESGWNRWRLGGEIKTALRQKQFLFLNETPPQVFNSLTDHMESNPLNAKDPLWTAISGPILDTLKKLQSEMPPPSPAKGPRPFDLGRVLWAHKELNEELQWKLEDTIQNPNRESEEVGWWARWALEHQDWNSLIRLGQATHTPLWAFVGSSQKGISPTAFAANLECGDYFRGSITPLECKDETLVALNRWITEKNEEEKIARREHFLHLYIAEQIHERIAQLHYINDAKWDVPLDLPHPPTLAELYLQLPRNHVYATQVSNLLGGPEDPSRF